MRLTKDVIGKNVTLRSGQGDTGVTGEVVAYCEAPMLAIRAVDGSQIWWRADLADLSPTDA